MKGKLIKTDVNYILEDDKGVVIASTSLKRVEGLSLSIKNCQAIERGYDLDELADDFIRCPEDMRTLSEDREINSFKKGFKKALELMGDKKFSENDVILISEYVRVASQSTPNVRTKDLVKEYQSLQQTEWDIEIEMEKVDLSFGCYKIQQKFDSDGCLILKRTI